MHTTTTSLEAAAPFAFDHSLSFLCSFAPTAGEQEIAPRTLTKAYALGDRAVLTRVTETPRGLTCALESETPLTDAEQKRIVDRVRFQLSLSDDLALFDARARADRSFAPIARRWRGHHHVKFASPMEITAWAILAQRNMRAARPVKDRLVRALGPSITSEGKTHHAFPEPRALTDVRAVRPLVRTDAEALAIANAAHVLSTPGFVRTLLSTSYDEALGLLRELPRIGPWSAAFILFRGLGRMERLADRSGPIFAAARRVYGPKRDAELRGIAESYGAWLGYWALYLRRS
jgi:DNA-3-methyladenine glycosylase II